MSWSYQQAVKEGLARGRAEGREQGIEQARAQAAARERALLRKQLALRFPTAPSRLEALLDRCDADDRAWLAEALLRTPDARTLHAALLERLG